MRGAFVAAFGAVDARRLETVADTHRWHRGAPEYIAAPQLHIAVRSDGQDGPHVEVREATTQLVHGRAPAPLADLLEHGDRFAVVESDGTTLRAARDPLGLAPLFYRVLDGALWLATEVAPLVQLGGAEADLAALSAQAALVPDGVSTGYVGIYRLLPGHVLLATAGLDVSQMRYWHPASRFGSFRGTHSDAEEELWARLLAAVDRCTIGTRTGVLVSGGLDSAAITAAAAQLRRPVSLVHVAFRGVPDAEEAAFAERVAAHAGADLDVVAGEAPPWRPEDDLDLSLIPYLTPPAYTANTGLARLAEQGVAVALDGNDGDGLFGVAGGEWGELATRAHLGRLLQLARLYGGGTVLRGVAHDLVPPRVFDHLRRRAPGPPTYLARTRRYFLSPIRERIHREDHERWRSPFGEWRWRQLRQVLPVTTIRMEEHELRGARAGIDMRHPFADRDLVDFAISLPVALKADPMVSKSLLRDALSGHSPEAVIRRPTKPGYLSILERRVDRGRCLEWISDSGVRLPSVDYRSLFADDREVVPLFMLLALARAHVFAART